METSDFLWKIGNALSSSNPAASRFYLSNLEKYMSENVNALKIGPKRAHLYCQHCGSLFSSQNSSLKIQPCPTANKHLKKLWKVEAEQPWKINSRQRTKIRKFREATNKIVYSCFICKRKTIFPGDKKCNTRRRVSHASPSTPLQGVKIKKGDLLAGLFISSASVTDSSKSKNEDTPEAPHNAEVGSNTSDNLSEKSKTLPVTPSNLKDNSLVKERSSIPNYQLKPRVKSKTPSTEKQSSQKKKRKTLLDEILEKEKKQALKVKPGLSSFLVSL